MTKQTPLEDLLERLRTPFEQGPGQSVEVLVRRFLEPFELVPKAEFEQQQAKLAAAEVAVAELAERVAQLEAQGAIKIKRKPIAKRSGTPPTEA